MPVAFDSWNPLDHGPLEQLADNLWRVEAALPDMGLRRHMIIVRTPDGRLLFHNGVAVNDEVREQIEALGKPTWLVVPNGWHRLDAHAYKERYGNLDVICPPGARSHVEKVVPVDFTYDELPPIPGVRAEVLDGLKPPGAEGVLIVESEDGTTLIFNDAVFNQPHLPGVFGFVYKTLGQSGRPKVSIITKMMMVKNKKAFRDHLSRLADIEGLVRVIPGHIRVIDEDAARVLREVAAEV